MAGNGTEELPEDRQKAVEQGLALFQQVSAERDLLRNELREAHETITRQRVEIESLHQLHNMLESHIQAYMIQRDEAVAHRAAYEGLFATIMAQLRVFNLPTVPLIKDIADATIAHRDANRIDTLSATPPEPSREPSNGSGQRRAVHDQSTGAVQIPRPTPVLAHTEPLLGQPPSGAKRPGWPSLGKQDPSRR